MLLHEQAGDKQESFYFLWSHPMSAHISGILLVSRNPKQLADFYREIIGVPLASEQHGDSDAHFGCEIGDLHFAIHGHHEEGEGDKMGVGAVKLAFEIFNMDEFMKKLEAAKIKVLFQPRDQGFMKITAVNDPDGNVIELTEMSAGWYKHLEDRRSKGLDAISQWKIRTSK
jgi:catechol 2,3-dioxygenase-like lactoylglutathione lyase family enzyme